MTDKPRKIVVCHPSRYVEVQQAVASFGHDDVLVQTNRYVPADKTYIMDNDDILDLRDIL